MDPITASQLLSVGGIAVATTLILALVVKKSLRIKFGLPAESSPDDDPIKKGKYSRALLLIALGVAEVLSFVATLILVGTGGEELLQAFLTGLVGAATAVGVSEYGSNLLRQ